VLTLGLSFVLYAKALFREYIEENERYVIKSVEAVILIGFLLIVGVEVMVDRKKCSLWMVIDVFITLWTMAWEVYSLFDNNRAADMCIFCCILRLIRPAARSKPRLKKTQSLASPMHLYTSVDSPPLRMLNLLKTLRRDSRIRSDKAMLQEVEWGMEAVSTGALHEPAFSVPHNDQNAFKTEDLMNMVKVFSVTPKPVGSSQGRIRAGSIADSIPIKNLSVNLPQDTMECLMKVDSYDFNVFALKSLTNCNELRTLTHIFFARMDLFEATGIDSVPFSAFMDRIQLGYSQILPYHTATHAADVLQALNYFLGPCAASDWLQLTPIELAGAYIAASVHDYEHPGVNNAYLVSTQAELAIRYNDQSVLENFHVSSAWGLTLNEEYDFLARMPREDSQKIRALTIEMVLKTDVAQHFSQLSQFTAKQFAFSNHIKDEDKSLVLCLLLHCADISNASRTWELCQQWTQLVMEEFWIQGDREREAGIALGYLSDKYSVNVAKSQVGFIDIIVEPLFKAVRESLPLSDVCVRNLNANRSRWSDLIGQSEKELEERRQALTAS
jgi:hypothetical protein